MKIKIFINIIIVALLSMSCEDWLDLKPNNKVTEEDLYKTNNGFRTALNGLYLDMSDYNLYGANLSFIFPDILSQQYDLSEENNNLKQFRSLAAFDYEDTWVSKTSSDIWKKAYNVIANANNLIANVKTKEADFFKYRVQEKNLIHGEALACRAFMHLDILRLFAPSVINDDNGIYIPYVDTYPNPSPNGISVKNTIQKIIDDLEEARDLVSTFDTTEIGKIELGVWETRIKNKYLYSSAPKGGLDEFLSTRGYRLNLDAITALLARAYQYAGQHDKALECAETIINKQWKITWRSGKSYDFKTYGIEKDDWENKDNLRLLNNLIFALYNQKLYQERSINEFFRKELNSGSPRYFVINKDKQNIFLNGNGVDESSNDVRYKDMIFKANNGMYPISGKWYIHESPFKRDINFATIPVIRLTEMYYIAAESYARVNNFSKAKELLTKVRSKRKCSLDITLESMDDFIRELTIDARREWIAEGQLFYLYKRLNIPVDFNDGNDPRPLKREEALVPIPSDQSL